MYSVVANFHAANRQTSTAPGPDAPRREQYLGARDASRHSGHNWGVLQERFRRASHLKSVEPTKPGNEMRESWKQWFGIFDKGQLTPSGLSTAAAADEPEVLHDPRHAAGQKQSFLFDRLFTICSVFSTHLRSNELFSC
jgi:hypothetical protein